MSNRFKEFDRAPADSKESTVLSALSRSGRRAVILLLEDEPIGEAYVRGLGAEFDVRLARTFEEAQKVLETEEIDVAILDCLLGDDWQGGFRMADLIADRFPRVPIIFNSAYSSKFGEEPFEERWNTVAWFEEKARTGKELSVALRTALREREQRSEIDRLVGAWRSLGVSFDLVLRRLIEQQIEDMRLADARGEMPAFADVVELYGATRFLYPAKLEELEPHFGEVERTWKKLLGANGDIFKFVFRRQIEGRKAVAKSSVCAFTYAPATWQAQHLVSRDRHQFTATLSALMALSSWVFDRDEEFRCVRLTYRPDNPGVNRLFGGIVAAVGAADATLRTFDYFVTDRLAEVLKQHKEDPGVRIERVDQAAATSLEAFYAKQLHPSAVDSLRIDELDLTSLDERYRRHGLVRRRAIFAAVADGRVVGAVICNEASEGINFSFLENAIEELEVSGDLEPQLRARIARALLLRGCRYSAELGRSYAVGMVAGEWEPVRQELGLVSRKPKVYSLLTFRGGVAAIRKMLDSFYDYYHDRFMRLGQSARGTQQ